MRGIFSLWKQKYFLYILHFIAENFFFSPSTSQTLSYKEDVRDYKFMCSEYRGMQDLGSQMQDFPLTSFRRAG